MTPSSMLRAGLSSLATALPSLTSAAPIREPGPAIPAASGGSYLAEMALGLALVIGCILLLAWLLRRMQAMPSGRGTPIKLVGGMPLGTRERVVLMQVGDTQVLLGVAPGRVSKLHVFDSPVVSSETPEAAPSPFARLLKGLDPSRRDG